MDTSTPWILRVFPLLASLRQYTSTEARADAVAGLTTGVMLIPQGMGYAMLAGLPPIHGLYAALAPIIVYALLGTSRHLAVGPVAMDSILVASGVGTIAVVGTESYLVLAGFLAVIVGVMQALLGLTRAGFLVNFLSRPVVTGFTAAAALIIAASQLHQLLGVPLPRTHHVHRILYESLTQLAGWSWPTLTMGSVSLVCLLVLKHRWPRVPGALLVVVAATAVVWHFDLSQQGIAVVGSVPAGLPSFRIPHVGSTLFPQLLPIAATIALVSFMEAISVGRALAREHHYEIAPNRELLALGLANIAGGVSGGYPIAGGLSRSAVNSRAGARSQVAGLVSAAIVLVTLLALTRAFYFLPKATLSAVIIAAVLGLVRIRDAIHVYRVRPADFGLLLLTFVATLSLGIQYGILVGVGASVFLFLVQTTRPHFALLGRIPSSDTYLNVTRHPHVRTFPGIVVLRIDAQLYFGNVSFLKETVRSLVQDAGEPVRAIVLEAAGVNQLDSAAADALQELDEELASLGIRLVLTRVKGPVRDTLCRSGFLDRLAAEGRIYMATHQAVQTLASRCELPNLSPEPEDPRAPADRIGCGRFSEPSTERGPQTSTAR